ncbi:MAG: hypothetical protein IJS15_07555 [Victivallales bacterium]|nr:hypothetical protein [Victivallales bacterium]
MRNDDNLFYTCSLIEYIGRYTKNRRNELVDALGEDIRRIYMYSDVFHCEPIEKVANDFIERRNIQQGNFDNIETAKYEVPGYWDIGRVFERLIEDVEGDKDKVEGIKRVYSSWIAEKILNFNSDLYYQPREYLAECYRNGIILDD